MYAIVRDGCNQHRVEEGAKLRLAFRAEAEPGATLTLSEVLAVGEGELLQVGTPLVAGASVTARVKGTVKGEKLIVYRYLRRKNSDKKRGHRQRYTEVVVEAIAAPGAPAAPDAQAPRAAAPAEDPGTA
jgi:large subunit ribosomal protein L21